MHTYFSMGMVVRKLQVCKRDKRLDIIEHINILKTIKGRDLKIWTQTQKENSVSDFFENVSKDS